MHEETQTGEISNQSGMAGRDGRKQSAELGTVEALNANPR